MVRERNGEGEGDGEGVRETVTVMASRPLSHHEHKPSECSNQLPVQLIARLHQLVSFVYRVPPRVLLLGRLCRGFVDASAD